MAAHLRARSRPGDLRLHLQPDSNAGPNQVQELLTNHRQRQMKLPKSRGRFDVDRFQDAGSAGFVKYNGDTLAPGRDNVPIVDPTSSLVSAGGDVDRNTGVRAIPNLQQSDNTPNTVTPLDPKPITTSQHRSREVQNNNGTVGKTNGWQNPLSRSLPASFSDPQLEKATRMADDPGTWNGRRISLALLRANMNNDYARRNDPPSIVKYERGKLNQRLSTAQVASGSEENDPDWKQQAILRYMYTSATQRSYKEVDWDRKLLPKVLPPATTLERHSSPVSAQQDSHGRYELTAHRWQSLERSWDLTQPRDGFHTRGPIAFCSPNRRNDQIPGYNGFVGGIGERDHPQRVFLPSTVMRSHVPKYTDTARRPNIPGYTGCVHPESSLPANANVPVPPPQTTARTHRYLPVSRDGSRHKKTSRMSKMVTLVPPCNPFNKVDPSMRPVEQFS